MNGQAYKLLPVVLVRILKDYAAGDARNILTFARDNRLVLPISIGHGSLLFLQGGIHGLFQEGGVSREGDRNFDGLTRFYGHQGRYFGT